MRPSAVSSEVAEQPVGWDEIIAGARNRARAAFASGPCALAVGIEDGLVRLGDTATIATPGDARSTAGSTASHGDGNPDPAATLASIYNVGCAWITDGEREGHGFSSGFAYPPDCLESAYHDQQPIGDLFDALWQSRRGGANSSGRPAEPEPSGRAGGNIGRLTGGRLDRSAYGAHAVLCALVPFLQTDLYDGSA